MLGAAIAHPVLSGVRLPAAASPAGDAIEQGTAALAPALRSLVRETYAGLAAFVCPGPDAFSVQQGETDPAPGGVDADGGGFIAAALDGYLPYPDALLRPFAAALAAATLADDVALPAPLADATDDAVVALDDALASLLANDATVPVSAPLAMLLNLVATTVDPASMAGPFVASPFANLDMAGKAGVFLFLDERAAELVAGLDGDLDEPSRAALSGLVRFVSNALVCFTAFGIYSEWSTSRGRGDVFARPVGWDLASFTPGEMRPADGWDEFRGYWRGRRANADDAPVFPRPESP